MRNIKNYIGNTGKTYGKKFIIPLILALSSIGESTFGENKTDILKNNFGNKIGTTLQEQDKLSNKNIIEIFDKETIAKKYLENNLFIKNTYIKETEFNHSITKIEKDKYQIKYSHPFEGIQDFSEPSKQDITINIKFTYKDNNIFIEFEDVKIKGNKLADNGILLLSSTVYDYDISQGTNKSIEINSKANPQKTLELIKENIKNTKCLFTSKINEIKEFENTQLTKLNEISLGKEVLHKGELYYREIFITEKSQYRPIAKVYFDKYGKLDLQKTNDELKNKDDLKILGVKVNLELKYRNGNIDISISEESINSLKQKVLEHRKSIIDLVHKAKVGPNTEFKGFNKIKSKRVWSDKEERLFNTELINLKIIDDTYVFQRGDKDQFIYFGIELNEGKDKIFLKNLNNEKIEEFFITIDNNHYKIGLKNNELGIDKIQKEVTNIKNNLPSFYGDKDIVAILENQSINHYYNLSKKKLEYRTNDGIMITSIPCEKSEKGEYKLNEESINIDIEDLYNFSGFKTIIDEIKKTQKNLNTLDIDILKSFETLLKKGGIKLKNQNLIKIVDKEGNTYYCTSKQNKNSIGISLDSKLYKEVEKTLKNIKSRLEIVEKLNNTQIRWTNNDKKEDFTKFIGGGRGIGTRFISQNNIISFVSQSTNEIKLNILRGEGESTNVIYDISPKSWKMKLEGKSTIIISGQSYKIKINEKGEIFLDPIEKKLK